VRFVEQSTLARTSTPRTARTAPTIMRARKVAYFASRQERGAV